LLKLAANAAVMNAEKGAGLRPFLLRIFRQVEAVFRETLAACKNQIGTRLS
jgi:hypothetical protein